MQILTNINIWQQSKQCGGKLAVYTR